MPSIEPKNITAHYEHQVRGNPPSTRPDSSIANCFPGLEFDFRNVWKHLFVGLELHEGRLTVVNVVPNGPAANQGVQTGDFLTFVDGTPVFGQQTNPNGTPGGAVGLEWSNALAGIFGRTDPVPCTFQRSTGTFTANLNVRPLFDNAMISKALGEPGALTQSLCSPWQADYRECGCWYWAASRPDFVNNEPGTERGHFWMQRDRDANTPKDYIRDDPEAPSDPRLLTYDELYQDWEGKLRFVERGNDKQ